MTSREQILNSIKGFQNTTPLELDTDFDIKTDELDEFIENAKFAGAIVHALKSDELEVKLADLKAAKPDHFLYESSIGVAENGALWCQNLGSDREKLFMCNDLIIKVKATDLVANMHQAYEKIDFSNREFGTFIAGPSKTADIEQSLVIGAHGAMALYILVEV